VDITIKTNKNMITTAITIGVPAVLALIIILYVFTLRRIVPTNVVHIVQRGKNTVSYGVGKGDNVYYAFPSWMPVIGVVVRELPVSNFGIDLHEYNAYDKDRVPFVVDIKAFFHISDTNKAAEKVESYEELEKHLENVVQGSVRSILAQSKLEEIMEGRSEFGEKFTSNVKSDLLQWGVEPIKNIELMDVRDAKESTVIKQIMAKRMSAIDSESRTEIAKNKQSAEQAELASKQAIAVSAAETNLKIGEAQAQSDQAVAIAKAESEKKAGIAKQESIAEVAKSEKDTAEKQMDVIRTKQTKQAEIDKETAIIASEQEARQMEIKAEAAKKQLEIQTNANKMKVETDAEARRIATEKDAAALLIKQENEAKGKAAVGKAEASIIEAKGTAEAEAKKLYELASVTAQTTLAKDIGDNKEYQTYMIELRKVEMNEKIGVAQAENLAVAMKDADLKVLVNSGDVHSGIGKLSDLFTSKGASQLNGLIEGLGQTEGGQAIVDLLDKIGVKLPTKAK
jgi:flotillin